MAAIFGYGCLIALLLGVAAWISEPWFRAQRWPQRWVWAAALLASFVLPVGVLVLTAQHAVTPATALGDTPWVAVSTRWQPLEFNVGAAPSTIGGTGPTHPFAWAKPVDMVLLWSWALVASALLGLFAVSYCRLRRRLRQLPRTCVEGVEVCVAERLGPAVFGSLRPQIILPRWLLAAPVTMRSLVLAHERAHQRTRDPLLFNAALLMVALVPWNLPLWWVLRRLRFAIEVDCDHRALLEGLDVTTYGETLLSVAQHDSHAPMGTMALLGGRSQLERRILAMMTRHSHVVRQLLFACALGSVSLVAAALQIEPPTHLVRLVQSITTARSADRSASVATVRPEQHSLRARMTDDSRRAAALATPNSSAARLVSVPEQISPPTAPDSRTAPKVTSPRRVRIDVWVVLANDQFQQQLETRIGGPMTRYAVADLNVVAQLRAATVRNEAVIVAQAQLLGRDQLEIAQTHPAQLSIEELSDDAIPLEHLSDVLLNFIATPQLIAGQGVELDLEMSLERVGRTAITSTLLHEVIPRGQTLFLKWHRTHGAHRFNAQQGDKQNLFFFLRPQVGRRKPP